jgi:hypothetical protein
VPAIAVKSSIADCPFTTVFEYETMDGRWEALLDQPGRVAYDPTALTLTLTIDQDAFLEWAGPTFATSPLEAPISVELHGRFSTTDAVTGQVFHDLVSIEVIGSGEVESDKCDYTSLSLPAGASFTDPVTYTVSKTDTTATTDSSALEPVRLWLPTALQGLDALTPPMCSDLVYLSLEIQSPAGNWEERWTSVSVDSATNISRWSPA